MRRLNNYKHTRIGDKKMKEVFYKTAGSFFQGSYLEIPFIDKDGRLGSFKVTHEDLAEAIYKKWLKY